MTSDIKEKIKMSKIEQLIGEIEEFIDGCKLQPFSSTKIVVDKAQLEDLLVELRHRTPDEIKKYQKILNNKDAIINDAKQQAEAIISAANVQTSEMVNQSEKIGPRLLLCKHSPRPGNYGRGRANQPLAAAVSTPLTMSWAEP